MLAGTGVLDLLKVSLVIAFGLIVARIVTLRDARRFIDANVLLLLATSFGLGKAVEQSGRRIVIREIGRGFWRPARGLRLPTGRIGNHDVRHRGYFEHRRGCADVSYRHRGSTEQVGANAIPFAVVVIFGASLSFLTPIGYQTNTMVWAMCGYRYNDFFARLGAPLTLFVVVAAPSLVPIYFPFH